jgi:hypothetical protein
MSLVSSIQVVQARYEPRNSNSNSNSDRNSKGLQVDGQVLWCAWSGKLHTEAEPCHVLCVCTRQYWAKLMVCRAEAAAH